MRKTQKMLQSQDIAATESLQYLESGTFFLQGKKDNYSSTISFLRTNVFKILLRKSKMLHAE